MRRGGRRREALAVAAAAVVAAILVVVAVPRIPPVWSMVWGTWDLLSGGVEDRRRLLRDHPFPAALAPSGYRLESVVEMCDPDKYCSGWAVNFAGPDAEDQIAYYLHPMTADEVYDSWRNTQVGFAKAARTKPGFLAAENLGPRSFCAEDELFYGAEHRVTCIAAFDGLAVIAESVNHRPERGSLENAVALLHAGVEHWKSISD